MVNCASAQILDVAATTNASGDAIVAEARACSASNNNQRGQGQSRRGRRTTGATLIIERRNKQLGIQTGWYVKHNGRQLENRLWSGQTMEIPNIDKNDIVTLTLRGNDFDIVINDPCRRGQILNLRLKTGGDVKVRWNGFEDKQWVVPCNTNNADYNRKALLFSKKGELSNNHHHNNTNAAAAAEDHQQQRDDDDNDDGEEEVPMALATIETETTTTTTTSETVPTIALLNPVVDDSSSSSSVAGIHHNQQKQLPTARVEMLYS